VNLEPVESWFEKQAARDDVVGELVRSLQSDPAVPQSWTLRNLANFLERENRLGDLVLLMLARRNVEIAAVRGHAAANRREADGEWVSAEIHRLYDLLLSDPVAAKAAIARHLEDGEIRITPLEGASGARAAMISGAVNEHGLLAGGHVGIDRCGGAIRKDRQPPWRSTWNPSGSRWICRARGTPPPRCGAGRAVSGRFPGCPGVAIACSGVAIGGGVRARVHASRTRRRGCETSTRVGGFQRAIGWRFVTRAALTMSKFAAARPHTFAPGPAGPER
jgi:hypothetical protein